MRSRRASNCPITILERYRDYTPPMDVAKVVGKALKVVPAKYLAGLSRIELTQSTALPRRERRRCTYSRGHKVSLAGCLGYYQPMPRGQHPYIVLYVDNILAGKEPGAGYLARQFWGNKVAEVLFHEIGHHIEETKRPEYRERENVADKYMDDYYFRFLVRRWPVLLLFIGALLMRPWVFVKLVRVICDALRSANALEARSKPAKAA